MRPAERLALYLAQLTLDTADLDELVDSYRLRERALMERAVADIAVRVRATLQHAD